MGDVDRFPVTSTLEEQLHQPLLEYYHQRLFLHMDELYAGIRMRKFPEDLRVYEELLWECRVDVVLELGLGHGGSALWFRDRLRTLARYGRSRYGLVIAVDRDTAAGRHHLEIADPAFEAEIRLVQSDVRDPEVVSKVKRHLPADARVLVIDDSAHRYDTTMATLRFFSPIVPVGGFMVIEDGHRDFPEMMPPNFPGIAQGVTTAIDEWLATDEGAQFVLRRDKERYIVTSSPRGFLQRVGEAAHATHTQQEKNPGPQAGAFLSIGQTSVSDAENSLVPPTTFSISSSESSSPRLAASSSADGRSGTFDSSMTTSFGWQRC